MKNTLSYLVFAVVASTSSIAFGLAVEDPCALVDCADGEICQILDQEECSCARPGDGEDPDGDAAPCQCDPVSGGGEAVCVPGPPPACDSDSDCSGGDVCVTYTYGECSGQDPIPVEPCAADDEECEPSRPEPDPEPCTEQTESVCVPQYAAPCEAAADCGAGFTCEIPEICTVTTGAPVACAEDAEECPDIPQDDHSCAPSEGDAYCRLIEVACDDDSDCQTGATCQSIGGESRPAIDCAEEEGCNDTDYEPAPSYCIPDGYVDWVDNGGSGSNGGKKVESAERTSFFNPGKTGGTGSKTSTDCSVSQGPKGFAAGALMLFAMMFGFRRKK